jgi:hypothetical protein
MSEKNEVSCYRDIDDEHTLEIIVYEDDENPDYYYVNVQPKWDCELDMVDFGTSAYSDESLTIEEVNDWLDDFWECDVGTQIIDACEREEYKYLYQLHDGYKGIKLWWNDYVLEQCSQEFLVYEFTCTLPNGISKDFKSSDRYDEDSWAEIRGLKKVWDWVESELPDE